MASMKFKRACIAYATTMRGIDPYKIVTAAQKQPDDLYRIIRGKGYQWHKKAQCWRK